MFHHFRLLVVVRLRRDGRGGGKGEENQQQKEKGHHVCLLCCVFHQNYFLVDRRGDLSLFHFYKTFHLYMTRKRGVILAGSVGVGVADVVGVL